MNDFKNIELTNEEIISVLSRRVSQKYVTKYIGLIVAIVVVIFLSSIFLIGLWFQQLLIGIIVIFPLIIMIIKVHQKERSELAQILKNLEKTED